MKIAQAISLVCFIPLLAMNQIGDEGAKAIGESLKVNTSLTELYLHFTRNKQMRSSYFFDNFIIHNKIEDEGGKAIGEALKTNKSLTSLDLDYTRNK